MATRWHSFLSKWTKTLSTQSAISDRASIEEYRDYLLLLARMQINPSLRIKVDASDVVQQVMLEACQCSDQFRGETEKSKLAWLRSILANVLSASARRFSTQTRDLRREQSIDHLLEISSAGLESLLEADQTSPSAMVVKGEKLSDLVRAIGLLPDDQRRVIELHHLQGMSLSEIAEEMTRSRPAIAGLLFRGLKRLRDLLPESKE